MKKSITKEIKRNITLTFSLSIIGLFIFLSVTTYFIQFSKIKKIEKNFQESITKAINHSYNYHVHKKYLDLLKRLTSVAKIPEHLYNQDRDAIYKELNSRFNFLKKENKYIKTMHVHNSDGTSFLRVHKPKIYGDKLSDKRPMIKAIHENKKALLGYERGVIASLFRVMVPLFFENQYVGAIEIGFFPQYIIDTVTDITGFKGLLYIKEERKDLDNPINQQITDGYRLFTENSISDILDVKTINLFQSGEKINWNNKTYLTYIYNMNDFQGYPKTKMIFFLDITFMEETRDASLLFSFITFLIVLIIIIYLINKHMTLFERKISSKFNNYVNEIEYRNNFLNIILNSSPNIILTTYGERISTVNNSFLEFFSIESLEEFTKEYDCICDKFIEKEGFLKKEIDKVSWTEYILQKPEMIHKAIMLKNDKEHIFTVYISKLNFDQKDRYMATLVDITKQTDLQKELMKKEELMMSQSRSAAMGDMISMIAHQWKQPLSALAMVANNMQADYQLETFDMKNVEEYYLDITKQVQHLSKTIDDFRDFFKPNKVKKLTSVQSVIDDSLSIIDKSLENNNINLIKDFKVTDKLYIFPNELFHIIINIINNAKEALIEQEIKERKIFISTYKSTDNIFISIEDNAGGIPEHIINKVFEPYFTTKENLNGTGIGLYMAQTIIEKHFDGKIDVENTEQGAKFTIVIPI